MSESRRDFLKIAGAGLVAGVGAPSLLALAREHGEPTGGKHWAMVIDTAKCQKEQGCTRCIAACHRSHNVPDLSDPKFGIDPRDLPKREIKWIWKESLEGSFPEQFHEYTARETLERQVLVLCNHCKSPPCVRVCPTGATWKRESDGIVMMDMHRCVGCRYCIVGCPYGSRSFNWRDPWPRPFEQNGAPPNPRYPTRMRGVVEKCTFCVDLLAEAEVAGRPFVPACVEACPAKALAFGDVGDAGSEVRRLLETSPTVRRKPALGTGPQVYYIV